MGQKMPNQDVLLEIIRIQTAIAKAGLDLGSVMELVTQHAQRLTKANGAVIELAEDDVMVYRATSGIASAQLGLRIQRQGSLSGLCVEQNSILQCDDAELDPRVNRQACRLLGLRSMLVMPLSHHDNTVGVLKVMSDKVHAFTMQDVQVLSLMSELIAAAMFHASKSDQLYYRATHDELTGLANRALFYDRLRLNLAQAGRHEQRLAVLNLDMDGLKPINDHHGHRAGDAALQEIARRIRSVSRQTDTVARVGGDEFCIILSHIENRAGVEQHCQRLMQQISQPFHFEKKFLQLGASIGIALYPEDGAEPGTLIERADQAMYAVKRLRKTTPRTPGNPALPC